MGRKKLVNDNHRRALALDFRPSPLDSATGASSLRRAEFVVSAAAGGERHFAKAGGFHSCREGALRTGAEILNGERGRKKKTAGGGNFVVSFFRTDCT